MASAAQNMSLGALLLAIVGGIGSGMAPDLYRDAKMLFADTRKSDEPARPVEAATPATIPRPRYATRPPTAAAAAAAATATATATATITVAGSGLQEARLATEIRPALVAALAAASPNLSDLVLKVELSGLDFATAGARRVDLGWQAQTSANGTAGCAVAGIRFVRAADLAERVRKEIANSLEQSEREGKMLCA